MTLTIYRSMFPSRRLKKCLAGKHVWVEKTCGHRWHGMETPLCRWTLCYYCETQKVTNKKD